MADAVDDNLDARGLSCPAPIIKLAERMRDLCGGQVLMVLADDAGALEDIPAWCRRTKNPLVSIEEREGVITAIIKKGG